MHDLSVSPMSTDVVSVSDSTVTSEHPSATASYRSSLPRCAVVKFHRKDDVLFWEPRARQNTGGLAAKVGNIDDAFKLEEISSRAFTFTSKNTSAPNYNYYTDDFNIPDQFRHYERPTPAQRIKHRFCCSVLSCVGFTSRRREPKSEPMIHQQLTVYRRRRITPSSINFKSDGQYRDEYEPPSSPWLGLNRLDHTTTIARKVDALQMHKPESKKSPNNCEKCALFRRLELSPIIAGCTTCERANVRHYRTP